MKEIIKSSVILGLTAEEWIERVKEREDIEEITKYLIKKIIQKEIQSNRLTDYFLALIEFKLISANLIWTWLFKNYKMKTKNQEKLISTLNLILKKFNPKFLIFKFSDSFFFLNKLIFIFHNFKLTHHFNDLIKEMICFVLSLPIKLIHSNKFRFNHLNPSHHFHQEFHTLIRHLNRNQNQNQNQNQKNKLENKSNFHFLFYFIFQDFNLNLIKSRFILHSFLYKKNDNGITLNPNFVFDFIRTTINLRNQSWTWNAFLGGGKISDLIHSILDDPFFSLEKDCFSLLTIDQLETLNKSLISDISQHQLWSALLSSLCSNQLVTPQDIIHIHSLSASSQPPSFLSLGHHSQIDLGLSPISNCLELNFNQVTISEIVIKLEHSMNTASKKFDLSTCISITKSIGTKECLTTLFLWIQPSVILIPIANILDHWTDFKNQKHPNQNTLLENNQDDHEPNSAGEFEKFAALLDWIQGVVGWFGLKKNLSYHLGRTTGFTISYLANPSTTFPIDNLPTKQKNTLESWLEALYGSSGISDELLIKTDPRIFFQICTTNLFKQSFDALKIGLIDLQLFRDGLSYFEQELLVVGSAVGVVGWLLDELERVGPVSPTCYPTALLEILQAILLSNSITQTSIDLISARSLRLLRRFNSLFSSITSTTTNEENHGDLNRRVQLDLKKIEKKLTTVPVSGLITPTNFLSFNFFDGNNTDGDSVSKSITWESGFKKAIKMAILNENDEGSEGDATFGLCSLLPNILEAIPVDQFIRFTIQGTHDALKCVDQDHLSKSPMDHVAIRVEPEWDDSKYLRLERAIQVAVEILSWPFDSHHYHQPQLSKLFQQHFTSSEEEEEEDLIEKYNSKFKLIGPVLLELFINWGPRVQQYQKESPIELDRALLERDIIIECLNRMQIHEKVCFHLSSSSPLEMNLNENGDGMKDRNTSKKNSESLVTDFFRQICLKSLVFEKINVNVESEKIKKRKNVDDEIEFKPNEFFKLDHNNKLEEFMEEELNLPADDDEKEKNIKISFKKTHLDTRLSNRPPSLHLLDWILLDLNIKLTCTIQNNLPRKNLVSKNHWEFDVDFDLQVILHSDLALVGLIHF